MRKLIAVVSGGQVLPKELANLSRQFTEIFWIGVDSGAESLLKFGIYPQLLIGDLDSLKKSSLKKLIQKKRTEIFRFCPQKDESDTYLALKAICYLKNMGLSGLKKHWSKEYIPSMLRENISAFWADTEPRPEVIVLGGIGSRIDHTLANLAISFEFIKEMKLCFYSDQNRIYPLIAKQKYFLRKNIFYPYISLWPCSSLIKGLSLEGFLYPLNEADVWQEKASLLISNQISFDKGSLSFKEGRAFLIRSRDSL